VKPINIAYIKFIAAQPNNRDLLIDSLNGPPGKLWSDLVLADFSRCFQSIRAFKPDNQDIVDLLERRLVSEFLLSPDEVPNWLGPWIDEHIDIDRHFGILGIYNLSNGKYADAPVALVNAQGKIRYFLCGYVHDKNHSNCLPQWAHHFCDDDAQKAISVSAKVASRYVVTPNSRPICLPIMYLTTGNQITGASLALPLALGFIEASTGRQFGKKIIATGALDHSGCILPVNGIDLKKNCSSDKRFTCIILPEENRQLHNSAVGLECIHARHIDEALMFAECFVPGKGPDLELFSRMCREPDFFISNLDHTDSKFIKWASRQNRLNDIAERIVSSPDLFKKIVDWTDKELNSQGSDLDRVGAVTDVINSANLQRLEIESPLNLFKWYTRNMAQANHRGHVKTAKKWAAKAEKLIDQAIRYNADEPAFYYNNRFIISHNIYDFKPEMPETLKKTISTLEKRFELSCKTGCEVDKTLGGLYGSIAQNLAFCGPSYFTEFQKYADLYRNAFGGGSIPEHRMEMDRHLHYTIYACLEAELEEQAEKALKQYLNAESLSGIVEQHPDMTQWQHAAVARFLADSDRPLLKKEYLSWAEEKTRVIFNTEHPWQLWLFNIGRIAVDFKNIQGASRFFKQSLETCLSPNFGGTVNVMGLMPLSWLWHLGRINQTEAEGHLSRIRKIALELNPDHFKILKDQKFDTVADSIVKDPQKLFPFTYR